MSARPSTTVRVFAALFTLILLLSACGRTPTVVPPTPTVAQENLVTSTPTFQPSPTADTPRVIMIPGQGQTVVAVEDGLKALAEGSGLAFEVKPYLQAQDITSGVKVVVTTVHVDGFAELAARNPTVQFVDFSLGSQPAPNLTVISFSNLAAQQAFVAGYVAAISTPEYRVGMLAVEGEVGKPAQEGFTNGVHYFCGICNSKYPPYNDYPVIVEVAPGGDFVSAAAELKQKSVKTVYISPNIASPDSYDAIAQAGMQLIGPGQIPGSPSNHWLATVGSDPVETLKALWPAILSGKAGQAYPVALKITDINETVLTGGKLRLVQQVVSDIQPGLIKVENP